MTAALLLAAAAFPLLALGAAVAMARSPALRRYFDETDR